eukprot:SAG31_NODE_1862_length_7044_cov_11.784017_1_plen_168_part_00
MHAARRQREVDTISTSKTDGCLPVYPLSFGASAARTERLDSGRVEAIYQTLIATAVIFAHPQKILATFASQRLHKRLVETFICRNKVFRSGKTAPTETENSESIRSRVRDTKHAAGISPHNAVNASCESHGSICGAFFCDPALGHRKTKHTGSIIFSPVQSSMGKYE